MHPISNFHVLYFLKLSDRGWPEVIWNSNLLEIVMQFPGCWCFYALVPPGSPAERLGAHQGSSYWPVLTLSFGFPLTEIIESLLCSFWSLDSAELFSCWGSSRRLECKLTQELDPGNWRCLTLSLERVSPYCPHSWSCFQDSLESEVSLRPSEWTTAWAALRPLCTL